MQVRFVGGPWHNRLTDVGTTPNPVWFVAVPKVRVDFASMIALEDSYMEQTTYHLHKFRTLHGTRYVQYIHESLLANNGKPDPCAYKERFKKWSLLING